MGNYYQKAVSPTPTFPSQHTRISPGQGTAWGARSPGYRLVLLCLGPAPCTCCLALFLGAATGPSPVLCPWVSHLWWFATRRRLHPTSLHTLGPARLDAALLHSRSSVQGAGCPERTREGPDVPQLIVGLSATPLHQRDFFF